MLFLATLLSTSFTPPQWQARRRLANRQERAVFNEALNLQQSLIQYERRRFSLTLASELEKWTTGGSPFALSQASTPCHPACARHATLQTAMG